MKMIVNRITTSSELPFDPNDLKSHSRVDFDDDDASFESMGQTAAAEFEEFSQIALLHQTIRVMIFNPAQDYSLRLPIGPVADDVTPTVTIDGDPFTAFDFVGGNRPYIRWLADFYNLTPDRMTIEYQAGFGPDASHIPRDIAQAIMDQTALLYDSRGAMDKKYLTTSPHMARIGARYRGVSI